jgi:WD40 repeat protein
VSGARAQAQIAATAQAAGYVAALAWAPDGRAVAWADDEGAVGVLEPEAGAVERVAEHAGGALAVAWGAGGLASGGRDGRLVLDGSGHAVGPAWIERVAWRPDGALLAVATGRRVQFWTPAGECRDVSEALPATVACLGWHPKGVVCAAGSYGGVRLIRANGGRVGQHLRWTGSVLELAFSPDGRRLAHGNQDASVHFWDLRRSSELEMHGYATKVRELAWSADGRWLATGGGTSITCWDFHRAGGPAGSRPVELERHDERLVALAFQPGGELLASAARDGLVLLWRVGADDLPVGGSALSEPLSALAWAPDGRRLAVGGAAGSLAVVDVEAEAA